MGGGRQRDGGCFRVHHLFVLSRTKRRRAASAECAQTGRAVGLVPEEAAVYPGLTARDYVRYAATLSGVADVDAATNRAIDTVDLGTPADRKLAGYSKGMRQRAKVAAALVA